MKEVRCIGFDNLKDTLDALAAATGTISFVSGGTRFVVANNRPSPDWIVDLSKVEDLKYIIVEDRCIRIGAGTTFSEIASHEAVRDSLAALAQAADQIGSVQNKNRATLGGNIACASPISDSLPVLAAFDARIITVDPAGERSLRVGELISNACQSTLGEKEIVREIVFPVNRACFSAFRKLGHRTTVTRSRLNLAVRLEIDPLENLIIDGKIVLGAVGPLPVSPQPVNDFLPGRKAGPGFAVQLAALMSEAVRTMKPVKEFRPYKVAAVKDCGRCGRCLDDRESRDYKAAAVKGLVLDSLAGLIGDGVD